MDKFHPVSALASVYKIGAFGVDSKDALVLAEKRGLSMVNLTVWNHAAVNDYLGNHIGQTLPAVCKSASNQHCSVLWIGPNRFLIVSASSAVQKIIASGLVDAIGMLQDVSSARTVISLKGSKARRVLAKGLTVDVDKRSFTKGQVVLSSFDHHFPAIIHNVSEEEDAFDIYMTRSFAFSFWEWLCDASLEVGYKVDPLSQP